MNDALFQIAYAGNPKIFRETYRYFYLLRPSRLLLHSLLAVISVYNLVVFYQTGDVLTAAIGLAGLIMLVLSYLSYRRMASTSQKRLEEQCAVGKVVTYTVYEDGITMTANGEERAKVAFESFRRGYQTKNLILLHSRANLLYILPNDSFTKGGSEGLLRFLVSRGIRFF